jgi:serine protease inhibitor
MAALGARGRTLAEMRQAMRTAPLQASDAVAVANGLWISNKTPLVPALMEALRREFDVDAHQFDPARLTEACEAINRWVAADPVRGLAAHHGGAPAG